MTFTVVGLGEVLWDLLPTGAQLGGAPANFAYLAAALGARAMMVTRVGDDDLGREVMERFTAANLPLETMQVDPAHPTGTVAVTLDGAGVPRYTFAPDTAWDHLAASGAALQAVQRADAVCFGTLAQRSATSRQAIQHLVAAAPASALKIFDVNLRLDFYSREVIEASMRLANVLKLNDGELDILAAMFSLRGDARERIEHLAREFDFKAVAVTSGASGSLIYQAGRWSQMPEQQVHVVDTIGAGDAFTAGLTMGLLARMDLDEAHAIAAELARFVCTHPGATPSLPQTFSDKFKKMK